MLSPKEFSELASIIIMSKNEPISDFAYYARSKISKLEAMLDRKDWALFELEKELKKLREENIFLTRTISEMDSNEDS